MKKFLFLILPLYSFSQSPQKIQSTIENVTVYYAGASVERIAKVSIIKGKNHLLFTGISQQIDEESIQISSKTNLDISSVKFLLNNQSEEVAQKEIGILNQQKEDILEKIVTEKQNLKVFQREEEMLLKNQAIGGSYAGLKANDLKEAVEFHRTRMQEILRKQLEINRIIKGFEKDIQKINQKLTEVTEKADEKNSEVLVELNAKEAATNIEIKLNYIVMDAGWRPSYNLKVNSIDQPLQLSYKGNIFQYSGEDWKNVKLSLSNANLKRKGEAPELQPWTWGSPNDYSKYLNETQIKKTGFTSVFGNVKDGENNGNIAGVSVHIKGTVLGTVTNGNGFYYLNIPPDLKNKKIELVFTFIGYVSQEKQVNDEKTDVVMKTDSKMLEEVVVTGYSTQYKRDVTGSETRILGGKVAGVNVQATKKLVQDTETLTTQNFDLIERFTVLADGNEITADLKDLNIPAQYEYITIPKIEPEAFLTAKIIDWEQYGLLKGDANLFYEGTFLGKTELNLTESDTLTVSLGRDKNIIVKREKLKAYTKSQFIGAKKTDNYQYQISIRNLKKQTVNLVVQDQVPVSNNKEVEIFDTDISGGILNKETGEIQWRQSIGAGQDKNFVLKYSVKYPKSGYVEGN
jgi:Domain of unknown function (DUF4139)/N-terminal domain of unknown function (DUF4140)